MRQRAYWFSVFLFMCWSTAASARSKPSACVAPTQAVTAAEQKDVAATVSAQAREVASGEASASGSTARSYATVLIDKGDVARLFAIYQWCMQREQGLISNEFYEQMVGQLQGAASAPPTAPPPPPSSTPATANHVEGPNASVALLAAQHDSPPPQDWKWLEGTWNLSAIENGDDTCAVAIDPAPIRYVWSVTSGANGTVTIKAMTAGDATETSFPSLSGTSVYPWVRVAGLEKTVTTKVQDTFVARETWFYLEAERDLSGLRLVGVRRSMGLRTITFVDGSTGVVPCFTDWDVTATR